ncbi:protein FRIGIDA-ESSENTIAL 1 [Diospyros lotus]|uniref:protein FRIGIDA-ESSENTIAL 1 n=1 Tax=Diospyros lotus TaxID=55363 RepID=UPI00224F2E86|nr:protein FRIGIDA-ESSENTIAL 1 [Diospyros lotus]
MPSNPNPPLRRPADGADQNHQMDNEGDDDEMEYEEVEEELEVEEEVEEEEEEEVEEEEEEEEGPEEGEPEEAEEQEEEIGDREGKQGAGEEKSPGSPVGEDRSVVREGMESKVHEEHLRSCSSDLGKTFANQLSDTAAVEGGLASSNIFTASEGRQKGESETAKSSSFVHKDVVAAAKEVADTISTREGFTEEVEIKKMEMESSEGLNQGPASSVSRSAVPQIRLRSLSPLGEPDANKRSAVICDFFAKGWCIKGNACKFLHIKEDVSITSQKCEEGVPTSSMKSGLQDDRERAQSQEHAESSRWHHSFQKEDLSHGFTTNFLQSPIVKDNSRSMSFFRDIGRDNLKKNWSSADYPLDRNSSLPDYRSFSGNSIMPSGTFQSAGFHSHASMEEDRVTKRCQFILNDHGSPSLSGLQNSSFSPSLPTTGILPSQNVSTWTMSYSSFSSLNKDPLGSQKLLDNVGEYRASSSASSLHYPSPFFGSEPEYPSRTNISGDPFCIAGQRSRVSYNAWELSEPFQPSYFITQSISSPGSLYDPIRDSIEQPNFGGGSLKVSSIPETSITNAHPSIGTDPVLTGTLHFERDLDKHSASVDYKFLENVTNKNFQGNDLFTTEGGTLRTYAEQQNRSTFPKEEKLMNPSHVAYISNDLGLQKDELGQKEELKVDKSGQNNEIDLDIKLDAEQKESKALKHFRAVLVDHVKELVKPIWHEGLLSKDAYKVIVKKSVDKVLSTVLPHQIPSTSESIKQYLSASERKLSKLVDGYVVKYGKS